MTRTKLARTVARSATGNTTALSSATSQQTSSAESVETLVTWREIAQTDSVAQIGAMDLLLLEEVLADLLAVLQLAELALAMQLIVNTR
jgi:hypothetical protein